MYLSTSLSESRRQFGVEHRTLPSDFDTGPCPAIVTAVIGRFPGGNLFLRWLLGDNSPDMTYDSNLTIREIEIQEQLETLYEQLEAFDEPTPADAPFEYEVEECELWQKLKEQIRILERELAEIDMKGLKSPQPARPVTG